MADCGEAGSVLDRAARAIASASGGSASAYQHATSLVGHAVAGNLPPGMTKPMPLAPPEHLVLPGRPLQSPAMFPSQQHGVVVQQPSHLALHHGNPTQEAGLSHVYHQQAYPDPRMMQMQQAAIAQQRQQQQAWIMQQQLALLQSQQQQSMGQSLRHTEATEATDSVDNWHDGLFEHEETKAELERHLRELNGVTADDLTSAHGLPKGATIEELAAAWVESQAEYENFDEVNTNLFTDYEAPASTYEFINKDAPDDLALDWMTEGMRRFKAGNLDEAIQAFETELQHKNGDNATAWRMLGRCHAENDMDQEAILCLEQAVERDPYSPEALLALGVSYVNELNHPRALDNLKAWITHNPKFAGLEVGDDLYGNSAGEDTGVESAFDEVQRLLLRALQFDPTDAADVLEALGVVYNVSREYEAAVDAFRRAIDLKPDDYQLWNKLGATLANSNKSDQALPAYHKALQLKPKYARAWLNMAISHSNLQNYDEAARCYLQTLSLNPSATHCWSYLRIALSCSERWDLIPLAAARDISAFHPHFDFVTYSA